MMTEEDWGGEAPLKVRAERKKKLITYIYLSAYRKNEKKKLWLKGQTIRR